MAADDEQFEHTVDAWTAGQLRAALDGVPDDLPLRFVTAEEPGAKVAGPEQVAYAAAKGTSWNSDTGRPVEAFLVELEFPPGTYYR